MVSKMAGLSDKERIGCANLLRLMPESDVRSLCETVTSKKIQVETTRAAIEAIVSYSNDAAELFKRRKVHRDIIFKYLANEGIVMPIHCDKTLLVKRTLEFWSSGKRGQPTSGADPGRRPGPPASPGPCQGRASVPQPKPGAPRAPAYEFSRPGPEIQSTEIKAEITVEQSSEQFCRWFFQLLNSQNPSLGQEPQDWGPQHFWIDAKLNLVSSVGNQQVEQIQGADLVHLRLLALVKDERLFLNPNLEPHGHRFISSPHGLVLVAVAGTIHRDNCWLGIFEQVFGLIRTPMENTWKIKYTDLRVRGAGTQDGAEGMSPTVTCDFDELQRQHRS
ncbi:uncharacterized protein C3orf38 homolog [Gadus chalcogrammus]|uniref:uncharacterized protein C3orf38 homolog n=1 Tax=Gadus chalcogrammus TaxID=1042646 RepID=UPI0024C4BDC4|nr:uncharacterized protein C3orf38 homolog [Gadus chalcogrammus]